MHLCYIFTNLKDVLLLSDYLRSRLEALSKKIKSLIV